MTSHQKGKPHHFKKKKRHPIVHGIATHRKFMLTYMFNLIKIINRPAMYFLFFLGFGVVNLSAFLFYLIELGINPRLNGYLDAVYFAVTTLSTVGYGDIVPVTFWGKILSMCMMFFGVAVFVMFTAVIARSLLDVEPILKELFYGVDEDE